MFRSRKRKVSPDKKSDKSKKLKVSSKIFRSPSSTKTNSEAKSKLGKLLPEGYESIILTANIKSVEYFEDNEAVFGCVRLPILTKEDAMVWVKKFERKTFTSYRTQRTWKKDDNTGLFKRKYICNIRIKDVPGQSTPPTCKGSIIFTIKDQEEIQANPEYYLRDYPSQVIIHFCHNHKIDPDSYMKNLRPSAELRIIFGTYFAKGHSPFSALICHKCDLHSSYGPEFYNVVSNGAICPTYNWCFHEYEKFFMRKFIEPSEDRLNEKLKEAVNQFNAKWRSECAIISYNPLFVISICTPLMKSIFRSGFAEELITVRCFSTPKTVPKRQKLILFLCHTPIGSLPFGVVVTFAEDTENLCEGIRALITMFGVETYSPRTIIIDENALLNKALKKVFPQAQILFNEFQMLQSIWRINRVVCSDDDEEFQALYNLFLVTLNSNSEEEFKKNFDSLLVYAEKYPKLTNFLKYFKVRSSSYVFYARPKIEFNTDVLNYTDSGTVILQDVSIKYGNFFNIVQLFDFLSKNYVDHYERKLKKIVEGDLKGFFKTNFYVPLSKIADFTCEKVSDTEFLVSLNDMKFFVNAELDTCTCQVGVHGGSCVHQYIVEKNLGQVPECYTPLCEDMLGIFKNILREKNIRPPLPDNDRLSELGTALDSLKSELESVTEDPDDFSDIVSSVCCSEISNFSEMPHDMDHLGPLDEIFIIPPDITDSFTDITDEVMSPLVLSEFDDTNEDNDDFLDDSQQYNRESGELEPIESSNRTRGTKHSQNNVILERFPTNLKQTTTGLFLNEDNSENVIIYEYTEEDIKCNNEVEIIEQCDAIEDDTLVHLPVDGSVVLSTNVEGYTISENIASSAESSVVYTYSDGQQGQVEFYEDVMTENDRKTAEIAEFLTNLPDTNNSNYLLTTTKHHCPQSTDAIHNLDNSSDVQSQNTTVATYITNEGEANEQERTVSNGVVVVKNEEYFTNYKVLEDNVLSIVPNGSDEFKNDIKPNISSSDCYEETSQQSTQSLITDSYEENNFIMMSPNDLFDDNQSLEPDIDKQENKINVLSSVVIKPPTSSPPSCTLNLPLNLNAIKHKTLRNVKEDSRIRMNEQKITQSGNILFIHDPLKSEPRKIVLPVVIKKEHRKSSDLIEINKNNTDKDNQTPEKDVIKLYCNQSGEKSFLEENKQTETITFQKDFPNQPSVKAEYTENCLMEKQELKTHKLMEPEGDSQELDTEVSDTINNFQDYEQSVISSEEMRLVECGSNNDQEKLDQDVSDHDIVSEIWDKSSLDSEGLILPDCDPEELAKNDFIEVIEMDSDGLDEIASQNYDLPLVSAVVIPKQTSPQSLLPGKSLKIVPLTNIPSKMLPFKSFSSGSASVGSKCIPLKDFMSKISPSKLPLQSALSTKVKGLENVSIDIALPRVRNEPEVLKEKQKITFSMSNIASSKGFIDLSEKSLDEPNINIDVHKSENEYNKDSDIEVKAETVKRSIDKSKLVGGKINQKATLDCDENRVKKVTIIRKLKEKVDSEKIDQAHYNKNRAQSLSTDGEKSLLNIKQVKTARDQLKDNDTRGKSLTSTLKSFAAKNQKVIITQKPAVDTTDNETSLSDFENFSNSSESFYSRTDELPKNEMYELQYLSDDGTAEDSVDDVALLGTIKEPVKSKLTNKLTIRKLRQSGPQTDDDSSSDESVVLSNIRNKRKISNLSSGVKSVPVKKTPHIDDTSKKTEKSVNLNDISSDESRDDMSVLTKYVRNQLPPRTKSGKSQTSKNLSVRILKESNKSDYKNLHFIENSCDKSTDSVSLSNRKVKSMLPSNLLINNTDDDDFDGLIASDTLSGLTVKYKGHSSLKAKPETKIIAKNLKTYKPGGITPRKPEKYRSRIPSYKNDYENPYDKSSCFSSFSDENKEDIKKIITYQSSKVLDQKIKEEIREEVNTDTESLEDATKLDISVLIKKGDTNECTKKNFWSKTYKPKQKMNPKIFNIKNRKISNTTLKLDSLPSVLSKPYNRDRVRSHKVEELNPDTSITSQTTEICAFKKVDNIVKTSQNQNDTAQGVYILPKGLKDELLSDSSLNSDYLFEEYKSDTSICSQKEKTVDDTQKTLVCLQGSSKTVDTKVNIENITGKQGSRKSYLNLSTVGTIDSKTCQMQIEKELTTRELIVVVERMPMISCRIPGEQFKKINTDLEKNLTTKRNAKQSSLNRSTLEMTNNKATKRHTSIKATKRQNATGLTPKLSVAFKRNPTPVCRKSSKIIKQDIQDLEVISKNKKDTKHVSLTNKNDSKKSSSNLSKLRITDSNATKIQNATKLAPKLTVTFKRKPTTVYRKPSKDTQQSFYKSGVSRRTKGKPISNLTLPNESLFFQASKHSLESSLNLSAREITNTKACQKQNAHKPITQIGKDIKDLEAILTSDKDVDRDLCSDVNTKNTDASILENKDLSFLFDDPRFETVVEEETEPAWTNSNNVSNILRSPIHKVKNCDLKINPFNLVCNEGSEKKPARENSSVILNYVSVTSKTATVKEIPQGVSITEYPKQDSLTKQGLQTKEKNHALTFLIFGNVLKKTNEPGTKLLANSKNKPVKKVIAKPEVNFSKNNTKLLNLNKAGSVMSPNVDSSYKDTKKSNSPLIQRHRNDAELVGTLESMTDELKVKRKITAINSDKDVSNTDKKRRSISSTAKITLTTGVENGIKSNPERHSDKRNSKTKDERTNPFFKISKTSTLHSLHPRRSITGEILTKTDMSNKKIKRKRNVPKKNIDILTPKNEKPVSPIKKVQNDNSFTNTPFHSHTGKDADKRKHRLLLQEGKSRTAHTTYTPEYFSKPSTVGLSFDYESKYDLENSIVASVLEKHQTPRTNLRPTEIKKEGSLIASTPIKSIGYEDAFKMFLENSNQWRPNTHFDRSLSDFEKDIDSSDAESNGGSRRRTKSVSSARNDNKKLASGKLKKSVSWAEGLNIIEYVQESSNDSDDSEIRDIPKKNDSARRDPKARIGKKGSDKVNKLTSAQKCQPVVTSYIKYATGCEPQDYHARLGANVIYEKQVNSPMSSTSVLQGRRRSLPRPKDSVTSDNRLRRSRSSTPKHENTTMCRKRSRSYTRGENFETELIILLERNKKIDQMCLSLETTTLGSLRSRRGQRVGYKELLERARLSKKF